MIPTNLARESSDSELNSNDRLLHHEKARVEANTSNIEIGGESKRQAGTFENMPHVASNQIDGLYGAHHDHGWTLILECKRAMVLTCIRKSKLFRHE